VVNRSTVALRLQIVRIDPNYQPFSRRGQSLFGSPVSPPCFIACFSAPARIDPVQTDHRLSQTAGWTSRFTQAFHLRLSCLAACPRIRVHAADAGTKSSTSACTQPATCSTAPRQSRGTATDTPPSLLFYTGAGTGRRLPATRLCCLLPPDSSVE
jgi:hypothetical protein